MAAFQTGLEGKPWYYGAGVGLLVAVGLVWLLHMWLLGPIEQRIERQETKLADLETKLNEARAAQIRLPQFQEQVRQLELELDKLLRILPARLNTQEILRNVRTLAEQGDFKLRVFEPATSLVDKEFYQEYPIKITLDGTYHNLAVFFDKIRRYPRIFNIEDLRVNAIRGDQQGPHTLTTSFVAKTFVYRETVPEDDLDVAAGGG